MIRDEIDEQIAAFLSDGGNVDSIKRGESGRVDPKQALPDHGFNQPKSSRTPVNEVISSIEARKKPIPVSKRNTKPKKEMLLDDFGEPLRWQWKDSD